MFQRCLCQTAVISTFLMATVVYGQSSIRFISPFPEIQGEFGHSIADAGDIDGDGIHDLVVGAWKESGENGKVYAYCGDTGTLLRSFISPNPSSDYYGNRFGASIRGVGDFNGNGYDDILIGSPAEDIYIGPPYPYWLYNAGRAYVFDGHTGSILSTLAYIVPNPEFVGSFGCAVDTMGDVNADGVVDFLIGSEDVMEAIGIAFIIDGANGEILYHLSPSDPNGANIRFGSSVAGIGDINNDGISEALVGSPDEPPEGSDLLSGTATIFDGASGVFIRQLSSPNADEYSNFGCALAVLSDINGDGVEEVVVGAETETPEDAPDYSGRAYVFDPTNGMVIHGLMSPSPEATGCFGKSVASISDFDGDGIRDIAVGAPKETCGGTSNDAGKVHIFSAADGHHLCTLGSPVITNDGNFGSSLALLENPGSVPRLLVGAPHEDPGPENSGRAYSIHLGFPLTTDVETATVTLSWTDWPGTSAYWVYGAQNKPYFVPEISDPFQYRLAILPVDSTSWTTTDYICDPLINMSYTVVAVDFTGTEMFRSTRSGEFDFDIEYVTMK